MSPRRHFIVLIAAPLILGMAGLAALEFASRLGGNLQYMALWCGLGLLTLSIIVPIGLLMLCPIRCPGCGFSIGRFRLNSVYECTNCARKTEPAAWRSGWHQRIEK